MKLFFLFTIITFFTLTSVAQIKKNRSPVVSSMPHFILSGSISGTISYPSYAYTNPDTAVNKMFVVKAYQIDEDVVNNEIKINLLLETIKRNHTAIGEGGDSRFIYYSIKGLPIGKTFVIVFSYLFMPGWKSFSTQYGELFTSPNGESSIRFGNKIPANIPFKKDAFYPSLKLSADAKDVKYNWQIKYGRSSNTDN